MKKISVIDNEALCEFCRTEFDTPSHCEGSRCKPAAERYLEEHGIDMEAEYFSALEPGDTIYHIDEIKLLALTITEVVRNAEGLRIVTDGGYSLEVNPFEAADETTFLHRRPAISAYEKKMGEVVVSMASRLAEIKGAP